MSLEARLEPILEQVQKPARYIGGELNSVVKDRTRFRFALPLFSRFVRIGMSHLGMKILSIKNKREDIWCEQVFAPAADMEAKCGSIKSPCTVWKPGAHCRF